MGRYSENIAANSVGSENDGLRSCQAHDVGISTSEDRAGTKGTMGKDTGAGEESGLADWGSLLRRVCGGLSCLN